jgi:TetR/AcrR family transcriptional regulator
LIDAMTAPAARREREKRNPEATRQALLRAGAELFSQRGFDGVPIEEVAARAGVNKALISYHFRGKRGLYVGVLESAFAKMAERMTATEKAAPTARDALHGMLRAFDALRRERPDFPVLFLREVLSSGVEPAVLPHLVALVGVSRRVAERGAREGTFRRVDPVLFHMGLVGCLAFFFATEPARRRAASARKLPFVWPDGESFLRYVEEITLRGLAPPSSSPRSKGARA